MQKSLHELCKRVGRAIKKYLQGYKLRFSNARLDEKLIRDPIFGFQRVKPYELLVIDSPLFQRLRGIFQTSVTYLTYPASIHTRFEHSLNCLSLSRKVIDALMRQRASISEEAQAEISLAALL